MFFKILQIAIPFVWFGAVAAISFMEAPLKFTAPNITIPLGLGVGMVIFHALNKIEIGLCILLAASIYFGRSREKFSLGAFAVVVAVLSAQTFVLFPMLDERALRVINGEALPPSHLHIVYILTDFVKIVLLFALGVSLTKKALNLNSYA